MFTSSPGVHQTGKRWYIPPPNCTSEQHFAEIHLNGDQSYEGIRASAACLLLFVDRLVLPACSFVSARNRKTCTCADCQIQ
jgi:hypothetical protein